MRWRRHAAVAGIAREPAQKQFLLLFGALLTFQETVRRVADPALFARPIVVTNGQYLNRPLPVSTDRARGRPFLRFCCR